MYDNFLTRAKRTVYKWWCIIYKPVYKLTHHGYWPKEKEPYAPTSTGNTLDAQALADAILDTNRQSQHSVDDIVLEASHLAPVADAPAPKSTDATVSVTTDATSALNQDEIPAGVDDDVLARANEIMARLNREAAEDEAKKQKEIEGAKKEAQKKADEQERLSAILKSNERSIDAYIQEGLSKQHQNQ